MKTHSLIAFVISTALLTGCLTIPASFNPQNTGDSGMGGGGMALDSGALMNDADRSNFMRIHNEARAQVGAAPLVWSDELSEFAQEWADELARRDTMKHRGGHSYGENLAYGTHVNAAAAARMWLDERSAYDGGPIGQGNFSAIGHYTQMIWGSTTEVGYGIARVGRNTYVVANYAPAGNVIGERP
ncbi:MAG: hypothetical protein JNG86_04350 [Verrucomicrobiaceae bacterium]|nr:hypothetical protein [Verrucomicrobiaceae bacterium]